jgi:hypothetical protein
LFFSSEALDCKGQQRTFPLSLFLFLFHARTHTWHKSSILFGGLVFGPGVDALLSLGKGPEVPDGAFLFQEAVGLWLDDHGLREYVSVCVGCAGFGGGCEEGG